MLWEANVPDLNEAAIGAVCELDTVGRRPFDVSHAILTAGECRLAQESAAVVARSGLSSACVSASIPDIPQADCSILTSGEKQAASMRVEGDSMYLAIMLMQLCSRKTCMTEIVQDDLATGGCSGDIVASIAFRPSNICNVDSVDLSRPSRCLGRCASDC